VLPSQAETPNVVKERGKGNKKISPEKKKISGEKGWEGNNKPLRVEGGDSGTRKGGREQGRRVVWFVERKKPQVEGSQPRKFV